VVGDHGAVVAGGVERRRAERLGQAALQPRADRAVAGRDDDRRRLRELREPRPGVVAAELAAGLGQVGRGAARQPESRRNISPRSGTSTIRPGGIGTGGTGAHGAAWLVKVKLANPAEISGLMDAAAYQAFVSEKEASA